MAVLNTAITQLLVSTSISFSATGKAAQWLEVGDSGPGHTFRKAANVRFTIALPTQVSSS